MRRRQKGAGNAVGEVVVDLARLRAHLSFDRDHAVEQVAEQAQLNPRGGDEQPDEALHGIERSSAEEESGAGDAGEDDREEGDRVGTDAEADKRGRERLCPCTIAALQRPAFAATLAATRRNGGIGPEGQVTRQAALLFWRYKVLRALPKIAVVTTRLSQDDEA